MRNVSNIKIVRVFFEGSWLWKATCKTYPHIVAYEKHYDTALATLIDFIETTEKILKDRSKPQTDTQK